MYQRKRNVRKPIVYIPKRIRYFDCLPEELIQIIVSACPFSSLSVCRQFFGIARQAIVKTVLSIPEPVRRSKLRSCYKGGNFTDLLKEMKSEHSLWYAGQFIGLSLSCLYEPMESEKVQFLQKLVVHDDGMALYYDTVPCRDNINLFKVLTECAINTTIIVNEDRVSYRILECPLIAQSNKQTLIKSMTGHGHRFSMFDNNYQPLPKNLLDAIIAEPNSRFSFFLSSSFSDVQFDLVRELYKKGKITGMDIKRDTVYNKDLLVASKLVHPYDSHSDSDYECGNGPDEYDYDIVDRYDDVIINEDACCFMDWARCLKD